MGFVEVEATWFGPLPLSRVRENDFTAGMQSCEGGLYLWTAERGDSDFRWLYAGASEKPTNRQKGHLAGAIGRNLERVREQRWKPLFWCARLCEVGSVEIEASEKALIYDLQPEWNRASRFFDLDIPIRLVSGGRRPPGVRRVLRLREGRQA